MTNQRLKRLVSLVTCSIDHITIFQSEEGSCTGEMLIDPRHCSFMTTNQKEVVALQNNKVHVYFHSKSGQPIQRAVWGLLFNMYMFYALRTTHNWQIDCCWLDVFEEDSSPELCCCLSVARLSCYLRTSQASQSMKYMPALPSDPYQTWHYAISGPYKQSQILQR